METRTNAVTRTDTSIIGTCIKIVNTSTNISQTRLAKADLAGVRTNLVVVIRVTLDYSVGTIIAFLFKEENYASDLRLNYKMGLEPTDTCSMGTIIREVVLVVILNKLKPNPKLIT